MSVVVSVDMPIRSNVRIIKNIAYLSASLRIRGLRSKNSFVKGFVTVQSGSGSFGAFSALGEIAPETFSGKRRSKMGRHASNMME